MVWKRLYKVVSLLRLKFFVSVFCYDLYVVLKLYICLFVLSFFEGGCCVLIKNIVDIIFCFFFVIGLECKFIWNNIFFILINLNCR